jgi:DNA-directed RNA polymerase specialized sigma24 family protein
LVKSASISNKIRPWETWPFSVLQYKRLLKETKYMRSLYKITNKALIFTLIGVFLSAGTGYSLSQTALRVPLVSQDTKTVKRFHAATNTYLAEKALVVNNPKQVEELPPPQKDVLTMFFIKRMKLEEIALKLGVPLAVARQYKKAGIRNLMEESPEPNSDKNKDLLEIIKSAAPPYKRTGPRLVNWNSDYQLVFNNQGLSKKLSKRQREVLTMYFIEGKSPKAIANKLEISPQAVALYIKYGLKRLRKLADQNSDKNQEKPARKQTGFTKQVKMDQNTHYQLLVENKSLSEKLSERERKVSFMLSIGKSQTYIAKKLKISSPTVHRDNKKLRELVTKLSALNGQDQLGRSI